MGRRRNRKKKSGGGEPSGEPDIPPGVREMMERVKEVVDRPEFEIYAALEDCNMEPNDAINHLMSQDPFKEVKSKRKKKKEKKEALELRSGRASGSSTHGDGDNIDRGECSISVQMSSSDHGAMHSELVQEKDDGMNAIPTSSIPGSGMAAYYSSQRVTPQSNSDFIITSRSTGRADYLSLLSQAPWGFQARRAMPEVVRMGKHQRKASSTHMVAKNTYQLFKSWDAVGSGTSRNNSRLCQNIVLPVEPNQRHVYGRHQAEDVSLGLLLASANLQQLNLHQEHDATPTEVSPAVIIPDHQVSTPSAYASSPQPTTQRMPNIAIFSDSVVTHRLALPSCSQPTLPVGYRGANIVGRPFPPQNSAFLRSAAIQQAYSGSNASQQSPAMPMLQCASTRHAIPPSRSGISMDNIAPLADAASGYGGFGNPANIPRNYAGTPSTSPAPTEVGREENLGLRTQPPSPDSPSTPEGEDASV